MFNKMNISHNQKMIIVYTCLTIFILAIFGQVSQFGFLNIDDPVYVTNNIYVTSGISVDAIGWAFSTTHAEFWHPLTWLSLMADYQLQGLRAGSYHVTNLILHILSTLLLFWLFNRMTHSIGKSAFVAAFFALHPLHVESVAWIAERKDVLSAFYGMLTLCFYVYYTEKSLMRRYLIVLFCFILALLSKPMVITLPMVMLLLDYWPLKRFQIKNNFMVWQLKEKLPFFILSAVFSIITLCAQPQSPSGYFPLHLRLANVPVSCVTYLEKTFWPQYMAVFYPLDVQIPLWKVLATTFFMIMTSAMVIVTLKRTPYLFVGWMWFLITLLPVIGIIQIGHHAMADRYHYLSSIGIAMMIVWGLPAFIHHNKVKQKILFPAVVLFFAMMAFLSFKQCGYWKNSHTLFNHALHATQNNYLAYDGLGSTLFEEGNPEEAIKLFSKAIFMNGSYSNAYRHRGLAYFKLGEYQLAINDFSKTLQLKPDDAQSYYHRGSGYENLGQYQSAIDDYSQAILLKKDYIDAYNNRGGIYFKLGQNQRAIRDYSEAIRLKHDYAEAYNNRAFVYLNQGMKDIGCADARKACELKNCRILDGAKIRGLCP